MSVDHIFLSYAKEDADQVRRIQARLQKDGFRVWRDEHDLLPGQDWDSVIRQAIRTSKVFVLLLSEHAVSKTGYVQREIREALDAAQLLPSGKVFILPVRLGDCSVPADLRRWQWVDHFRRGGYERLRSALTLHVGQTRPQQVSSPPASFADPADALLYKLLKQSGRVLYAHLANQRCAIGQGHFYFIQPDLPEAVRELGAHVTDFRRVARRLVTELLVRPSSWRQESQLVRRLAIIPDTKMMVVATNETISAINADYWALGTLAPAPPKIYFSTRRELFYIEQNGRVRMIVAPMRASQEERALLA